MKIQKYFIVGFVVFANTWCELSPLSSKYSQIKVNSYIDTCIAASRRINSVSCKFYQKTTINSLPSLLFEGSIDFCRPNKIILHFLSPEEEVYYGIDSIYTIYSIKNKVAFQFKDSQLQRAEKHSMALIGNVKMNMMEMMKDGYEFDYVACVGDSDVVLSARPKTGWKELSKIWVKLSIKKKYLVGLELYDKRGVLISQTIFYEPMYCPDSKAWFPTAILIKSMIENDLKIDKIFYSRLTFNQTYSPCYFTYSFPKDVEIINQTNE